MISFVDFLKTSAYFSKKVSRSNLLFWLGMGPFLVITALSIALFKFSGDQLLLPIILLASLILSYKWKMKGFILSSSVFIFYFFIASKTVPKEAFLFHSFFYLSILIGLFITALISDEIRKYLDVQWKTKDANIFALSEQKEVLDQMINQHQAERLHLESTCEDFQKRLEDSLDYGNSLKKLIQVAQQESKNLREENQEITNHFEKMQIEASKLREALQDLDPPTKEGTDTLTLDEELNRFRVENYKLHILIESYEKELEKYKKIDAEKSRLLFQKQEIETENNQQLDFLEEKEGGEDIRRIILLTRERNQLKSNYELLIKDYDKLNKRLEEAIFEMRLSEVDSQEMNTQDYEKLKTELVEKNEILQQTRGELFKMEGELFSQRQDLDEKEFSVSNTEKSLSDYLSFTDQECRRLEEENHMLRDIIDSLSKS